MERYKTSSHRKTNFSLVWILLALKFSRSKTCLILNIQKNVQFLFRCYGIENKNKTSIFLKYVLLRYFFIFQHGEKDFKYKRKWNILTFEITLIILAYMIRELFTQNNSFLLLVFFIFLFLLYLFFFFFFCFFVFVLLQRASGECFPMQKHCYHQFLSENVCHNVTKISIFLKIFQSE